MTVIVLTADLTVVSHVDGAAARLGITTRAVSGVAAAVESCAADRADLLIVDLSMPLLDVKSLVEQIKAADFPPRIVAFGPHVHVERLDAARSAGCDEVISRGKFISQLDAVLGDPR